MPKFQSVDVILDFAIKAEEEAVVFYNKLALEAVNDEMKEIFKSYAQEEMVHKAKLMVIKDTGVFPATENAIADLKIADFKANVKIKANMTYEEALVVAMKMEKAAFKLYMTLAEKVKSPELKKIFLMLATEESKHKLRFELEYDEHILREN